MKKMVCEICGSQSIRKENGVFVCQECGTEYSLEEAKNLLKDVDDGGESITKSQEENKDKAFLTAPKEKDQLINVLHAWYEYAVSYESALFNMSHFIGIDNRDLLNDLNNLPSLSLKYSPKITYNDLFYSNENLGKVYLQLQYIDNDGKPQNVFSPYNAYSRILKKLQDEHYDFVKKNQSIFENLYEVKHINNKDGSYADITRDVVVRSKTTKKYYAAVGAASVHLESIMQRVIREGIPLSDLEIVETERTKGFDVVEKRTGLFSKHNELVKKEYVKERPWPNANYVMQFIKKGYDVANGIVNFYNEQYDNLLKHADGLKNRYKEVRNLEGEYVKIFDLPSRYRNTRSLSALIELLYIGREDDWKEAMNLYENDKYHANVLSSLSAINANLGRINTTLMQGFSYLGHKMDMTSSQLDTLIDKTSKTLEMSSALLNEAKEIANKEEYVNIGIKLDFTNFVKVL